MNNGTKLTVGLFVGVIILMILLTLNPFVFIKAGERGVLLRFGAVTGTVLNEGVSLRLPLVQSVVKYDVKVQKEEVGVSAASRDLQTVTSKVALNYHVNPNEVDSIYQNFGKDYKSRLIDPYLQESVKAITAKFTAEELITKREQVRDEIKTTLTMKFDNTGLVVNELNIVDFDFSDSFNAAIEAKVTAEQTALAAKNKLEQVKYEAQQQVESAKAQAETIRIQAEAITSQGGAEYVNLKAVERWNGVLPNQMIPGATLPFINLNK